MNAYETQARQRKAARLWAILADGDPGTSFDDGAILACAIANGINPPSVETCALVREIAAARRVPTPDEIMTKLSTFEGRGKSPFDGLV